MTKRILAKAVTSLRWMVVILAMVALTLSGASAAQRLLGAYVPSPQPTGLSAEGGQVLMGPASPGKTPENMTPSGKPNSEPYAYLTNLLLVDCNNNHSRLDNEGRQSGLLLEGWWCCARTSPLRSTASLVSSRLGVQYTLVGAKPSGTS